MKSLKAFFMTMLLVYNDGGFKKVLQEFVMFMIAAIIVFVGLCLLLKIKIGWNIWIPLSMPLPFFLSRVLLTIMKRGDVLKNAKNILEEKSPKK